eukprot:4913332-Prymnesium_polylepis.1
MQPNEKRQPAQQYVLRPCVHGESGRTMRAVCGCGRCGVVRRAVRRGCCGALPFLHEERVLVRLQP